MLLEYSAPMSTNDPLHVCIPPPYVLRDIRIGNVRSPRRGILSVGRPQCLCSGTLAGFAHRTVLVTADFVLLDDNWVGNLGEVNPSVEKEPVECGDLKGKLFICRIGRPRRQQSNSGWI
jgi:hypothetical protein